MVKINLVQALFIKAPNELLIKQPIQRRCQFINLLYNLQPRPTDVPQHKSSLPFLLPHPLSNLPNHFRFSASRHRFSQSMPVAERRSVLAAMENGVVENGVCSSESANGSRDVWSSKESESSSADHLVVMVHGIMGTYDFSISYFNLFSWKKII